MVPTSFQNLRALRIINIAAVGLALAGVVAPLLDILLLDGFSHPRPALAYANALGGVPTLICGMLWAWLLRRPQTVGCSPAHRSGTGLPGCSP